MSRILKALRQLEANSVAHEDDQEPDVPTSTLVLEKLQQLEQLTDGPAEAIEESTNDISPDESAIDRSEAVAELEPEGTGATGHEVEVDQGDIRETDSEEQGEFEQTDFENDQISFEPAPIELFGNESAMGAIEARTSLADQPSDDTTESDVAEGSVAEGSETESSETESSETESSSADRSRFEAAVTECDANYSPFFDTPNVPEVESEYSPSPQFAETHPWIEKPKPQETDSPTPYGELHTSPTPDPALATSPEIQEVESKFEPTLEVEDPQPLEEERYHAAAGPAIDEPAAPATETSQLVQEYKRTPFEEKALANLNSLRTAEPYRELASDIAAQFPPELPAVILTAGIESSSDLAEAIGHTAVVLAENVQTNVLLIDADFSEKSISKSFQLKDAPGISDIVRGNAKLGECVFPASIERLQVLPAGSFQMGEGLDDASQFGVVLHQLRSVYNSILVNVGPAEQSFAQAIGRYCDATYLYIELGSTDLTRAQKAVKKLRRSGHRIVGSIIGDPS